MSINKMKTHSSSLGLRDGALLWHLYNIGSSYLQTFVSPHLFWSYCHSVQIYNFPHIFHIFLLALFLIFCTFITECVEMQLTLGFGLFILLNSLTILASSFFGVFYMDHNFICCPRPLAPISFSYSDH